MRAAAVVFAGSGLDDPVANAEIERHVAALRADGAAVVHLSPHAGGGPDVGVDNAAGIAGMVVALARLGHRSIAFLAGPRALFVARERLDGFRRGLGEAGLEADERLVVHGSFDRDGGAAGIDALLAGVAPFTAVACANDLLALGALARLEALGIPVPSAVSVAGFDDVSVAAITAPPLSTVALPLREMGRLGFRQAEAVLAGAPLPPDRLPTRLVLRGSTGSAPAIPLPDPLRAVAPHLHLDPRPAAAPTPGATP
jgi:LacI family transcriptional regulator